MGDQVLGGRLFDVSNWSLGLMLSGVGAVLPCSKAPSSQMYRNGSTIGNYTFGTANYMNATSGFVRGECSDDHCLVVGPNSAPIDSRRYDGQQTLTGFTRLKFDPRFGWAAF